MQNDIATLQAERKRIRAIADLVTTFNRTIGRGAAIRFIKQNPELKGPALVAGMRAMLRDIEAPEPSPTRRATIRPLTITPPAPAPAPMDAAAVFASMPPGPERTKFFRAHHKQIL